MRVSELIREQTRAKIAEERWRKDTLQAENSAEFADRINPTNLGFSPKMTAIVGAIIGHDYGVRDSRGGYLSGLSITSDGHVVAQSTAHESGAFIETASDLDRNLELFTLALHDGASDEDAEEFEELCALNIRDWRKL